jgi:coproporphyrinogen III oxidase
MFIKALTLEALAILTIRCTELLKVFIIFCFELFSSSTFEVVEWFRNQGKNGGGTRYQFENSEVFNRATINASYVYFDNPTSSSVSSATAPSAIIHPA